MYLCMPFFFCVFCVDATCEVWSIFECIDFMHVFSPSYEKISKTNDWINNNNQWQLVSVPSYDFWTSSNDSCFSFSPSWEDILRFISNRIRSGKYPLKKVFHKQWTRREMSWIVRLSFPLWLCVSCLHCDLLNPEDVHYTLYTNPICWPSDK